jgi:putative membrane protein
VNLDNLPTLNAFLNLLSAVFLTLGYVFIKRQNRPAHKKLMISAMISSALFLTSYLIYHYHVGSVPYHRYDWTRPIYYTILAPHIILAAVMVPFILAAVWFALRADFQKHKRIVRWLWPVWMFVSISGILIYLMLYRL